VLVGGEEVGAEQMSVAVGLVGVDRGHLDRGLDPGVGQGLADAERGVETAEPAAHVGQTDVADLEAHARVHGIERPGAGG
jgi:hypothetical protein